MVHRNLNNLDNLDKYLSKSKPEVIGYSNDDNLRCSKGILIAVSAGLIFWAGLLVGVLWAV